MPQIETVTYYNTHADAFFSDTQGVDMASFHRRFLAHLPAGAHILDAGCGSGRDSKAYLSHHGSQPMSVTFTLENKI